jgi:hypothetical protein
MAGIDEVLTQVIGNILPGSSSLVLLRLMIMFGEFAMTSRLWLKIINLVTDEPLVVFKIVYCIFLFLTLNFIFLRVRYCTKVASLCAVVATLLECAMCCWQPSVKFVTQGKRVLPILRQICNRVSEVVTVPDKRSRILEVVVVRRIFNLGTGNLEWGGNGRGLRKGRSVYE